MCRRRKGGRCTKGTAGNPLFYFLFYFKQRVHMTAAPTNFKIYHNKSLRLVIIVKLIYNIPLTLCSKADTIFTQYISELYRVTTKSFIKRHLRYNLSLGMITELQIFIKKKQMNVTSGFFQDVTRNLPFLDNTLYIFYAFL